MLDPQTPFGRLQEEIEVEHRTCDTCFVEVTTPELGRRGSEGGQGSGSGTAASVAGSELAELVRLTIIRLSFLPPRLSQG